MKTHSDKEVAALFHEYNTSTKVQDVYEFLEEKGLIGEQFEVGKWYMGDDGLIFHITNITQFRNSFGGYGFGDNGNWFNDKSDTIGVDDEREATPQEVESALIKEAKKRGFKEGCVYDATKLGHIEQTNCSIQGNNFEWDENTLMIDRWEIFRDGKWAEIVEEKKEEKEVMLTKLEEAMSGLKENRTIIYCDSCDRILVERTTNVNEIVLNGETYIKK